MKNKTIRPRAAPETNCKLDENDDLIELVDIPSISEVNKGSTPRHFPNDARVEDHVNQCSNALGPLNEECRCVLKGVLENPTQATWDAAHSLVIDGNYGTLWQAWYQTDANAPRSKPHDAEWPVLPDQLALFRALRFAHTDGIRVGIVF